MECAKTADTERKSIRHTGGFDVNIQERIEALRTLMKKYHYDAYLVPSDDDHQSEYVGEHFKARAYITGFTGSAGTAVITQTEAGLWTDGRYFIQAGQQLEGSPVTLYRSGMPDVPTVETFLQKKLPSGGTLGFDGRVVSVEQGRALDAAARRAGAKTDPSGDLIDQIWNDRPPLSKEPAFALDVTYTGETTAEKLARIREAMRKENADTHILASLDDICWITNLRGKDIEYFPLLLCYAVITPGDMRLYIDETKLSKVIRSELLEAGITLRPYRSIYDDVRKLPDDCRILADPARLNYALWQNFPKSATVIERTNPSVLMKSVKNETEIQNIRNAHIKDGVAVTRFMYWLKQNVGKTAITEISAARKLESFRQEQDGYLWQSFEPICGFAEHGAIIHYAATKESDLSVTADGFLLTDTGGGYLEGSTDITRTFALGTVTDEMKRDFTTVLKCNLRLAGAVFPHGTCGYHLDTIARMPLWERGLDYRHGTGHGVGYLMNIHEAPCRFSPAVGRQTHNILEPGMVITDEPGFYKEGAYGIRIENELLIRKEQQTSYGSFLSFEPLTCVPIDLDAVDPDLLEPRDKELLNAYHAKVFAMIAPHLDQTEQEWLRRYTRAV